MIRQVFDITGMSCAACSARVQNAVEKLNGVKSCSVNLLKNTMDVTYIETEINENDIISAVKKSGYGASVRNNASEQTSTDKLKKKLIKFFGSLSFQQFFYVFLWLFLWDIWLE